MGYRLGGLGLIGTLGLGTVGGAVAVPLLVTALPVFESALRSFTDLVHWSHSDDETDDSPPDGPVLVAHAVKRVPPDAIVSNSWADPIKDCSALQYILKEAFHSQKIPKLVLTKAETVREVTRVFSLLPYTEGEEDDERDGYYINTSQGVVVLTLESPLSDGKY